jgi:hypothetical protein
MEEFKTLFEMLEDAYAKLKAKQPKNSNQRNIENLTRKYIQKATPYLRGISALDFKLEANGKGTPPPQPRKVEPEVDDSNDVVLASNAETPKAQKKQRRTRKKKN